MITPVPSYRELRTILHSIPPTWIRPLLCNLIESGLEQKALASGETAKLAAGIEEARRAANAPQG